MAPNQFALCFALKVTPFALASKKERSQSVNRLTQHMKVVEEQLGAWHTSGDPAAGELSSAPVLQSLGFPKTWLTELISAAAKLKDDTASQQARLHLGQIKLLVDATHKVLLKLPNPCEEEAQFMKYMGKHGTVLATKKAEMEAANSNLDAVITKYKIKLDDFDGAGDLKESKELAQDSWSRSRCTRSWLCSGIRTSAIRWKQSCGKAWSRWYSRRKTMRSSTASQP